MAESLPSDGVRIVVIGTSGSGKTMLARQIAAKLQIQHIELDILHHGPNWQPRDDFAERVSDAVAGSAWVCDGNYSRVRQAIWARGTAFVWLDYSLPLTFVRGFMRTVRRVVSQEEVFPGCRETFREAFLSSAGIQPGSSGRTTAIAELTPHFSRKRPSETCRSHVSRAPCKPSIF